MEKNVELPRSWRLGSMQDCVIGSLLDEAGDFVSSADLCEALYGEATTPSPAKLRVLIQVCRETLADLSDGEVKIVGKRNYGWKFTIRSAMRLKKLIEAAD